MSDPILPKWKPGTWSDAGLLREQLAYEYGVQASYGMSFDRYWRFEGMKRRLAKLAGKTVYEVEQDLKADYEAGCLEASAAERKAFDPNP